MTRDGEITVDLGVVEFHFPDVVLDSPPSGSEILEQVLAISDPTQPITFDLSHLDASSGNLRSLLKLLPVLADRDLVFPPSPLAHMLRDIDDYPHDRSTFLDGPPDS